MDLPTLHLTSSSATILDTIPTAVYSTLPGFSMLPCTAAHLELARTSHLTISQCSAFATSSSGDFLPSAQIIANTTHSYCEQPPCVACSPQGLAEAACLPGVYIVEYLLPVAALPQDVSQIPTPVRRAVAVAQGSEFSIRIDLPAPSAAAAATIAGTLASDEATLRNVSRAAQAQAFAALAGLNSTSSGRVMRVESRAPSVTATSASGSPVAVLEVKVEFLFIPGFVDFTAEWPDGVNISTAAVNSTATARRRLLQGGAAVLLEPQRRLTQTDTSSLEGLLADLSSSLLVIADSVADSVSSASISAGASGAPTATASDPQATTPEVTTATVLRAEVTTALIDAAQGLITTSLQLLQSLDELPGLQASLDGYTGTAREHFLSTLTSWDSFIGYMDWIQVFFCFECHREPMCCCNVYHLPELSRSENTLQLKGSQVLVSRALPDTPIVQGSESVFTFIAPCSCCFERGCAFQGEREEDLLSLQASMADILSAVSSLGTDVNSQSTAALVEILTVNMHSLQLAQEDSMSVQNLLLDLAPSLALDVDSQV